MSSATGINEDSLLCEIEDLLEKGQLKGRIDLIDKVGSTSRTLTDMVKKLISPDIPNQRIGPEGRCV